MCLAAVRRGLVIVAPGVLGVLVWGAADARATSQAAPPQVAPKSAAAAASTRGPGAMNLSVLGSWRLDHGQTAAGQDAWRRRIDAMEASSAAAASVNTDPTALRLARVGDPPDWRLRSSMRDLLETAEGLSFRVEGSQVTIVDDLNRSLTYATSGAREKRQLAATQFDVRTTWNGATLRQEIAADTLAITEIYFPSESGDLIVSLHVAKPEFTPPLKDITRIYVRQ